MLEGAAARSESVQKVELIQNALDKRACELGVQSVLPQPPAALLKSGSWAEADYGPDSPKRAATAPAIVDLMRPKDVVEIEMRCLEDALSIAEEQRVLMNEIYSAEDDLEDKMRHASSEILKVPCSRTCPNTRARARTYARLHAHAHA